MTIILTNGVLKAQTTTFDIKLISEGKENGGKGFEINDSTYYYLGTKEDQDASTYLYDINFIKINNEGSYSTKPIVSQDSSVGIGFLKALEDNLFLGIGYFGFNSTVRPGGIYNVIFNSELKIVSKKIFNFPEPYTFIFSSPKKILTTPSGSHILVLSLTEKSDVQGHDPGDLVFYEFDPYGDTLRTSIYKQELGQRYYDACFNTDSTQIWVFGIGFREGVTQWVKFDLDFKLISIEEFYSKVSYPFHIKRETIDQWIGCSTFIPHDKGQNDELWVFRMDSNGVILNEIVIGTPDTIDYASFGRSVDFSENGDIYISGTHNLTIGYYPNIPSWIMLSKLDNDFNLQFTKYYNSDDKYYDNIDLLACSDGGVILSNIRYDSENNEEPPYDTDAWIFKVDANGFMTDIGETENATVKNALVYPNPGMDFINVSCGWPRAEIKIYDINGRLVLSRELEKTYTVISTRELLPGKYAWAVSSANKLIETGKWIKTQ
ncbi:MAG: T9SS type A sorting domain-containing protein [Chlorobi bacterium]|nr:T9SS type A sorting domain-containing protein [Chlorobiota bacterium]